MNNTVEGVNGDPASPPLSHPVGPPWLAGAYGLTGPLAYLAPLGMAPLVALAGLAVLRRPVWPPKAPGALGFAFALVGWAAVSLLWSPAQPWRSASSVMSLLQHLSVVQLALLLALTASLMRAAQRQDTGAAARAGRTLAFSLLGLSAALVIEGLAHAEIYGWLTARIGQPVSPEVALVKVAQGGYILSVLMWPALLALWREQRKRAMLALPVGVLASTLLLGQSAPVLGLAAGGLSFVMVSLMGRRALRWLCGLQIAYWVGAPWDVLALRQVADLHTLQSNLSPSWAARLRIWDFAVDRIMEKPILGWGIDASRAFAADIPLHPHDWALQVWLELGLPGVAAVVGAWLLLFKAIEAQGDRQTQAAMAAATGAYVAICSVSFGIAQQWWLAVGAIALCACITAAKVEPAPL